MNSQRKTCALFCIFFGLFAMHINAMESHQSIIVIPQENSSTQNLILFGTGFAFGAGCVGLFYWYNNNQQRFKSLEHKMEKIKEEQQVLKKVVESQKELQEEETTRLNQTRAWVMDNREKQNKQKIKTAINNVEQQQKFKKLKKIVNELKNAQETFYSFSSSSAE